MPPKYGSTTGRGAVAEVGAGQPGARPRRHRGEHAGQAAGRGLGVVGGQPDPADVVRARVGRARAGTRRWPRARTRGCGAAPPAGRRRAGRPAHGGQRLGRRAVVDHDHPHAARRRRARGTAPTVRDAPLGAVPVDDHDGQHGLILARRPRRCGTLGRWTARGLEAARDLLAFIDASPSPFHACATAAERLEAAGFTERRRDRRLADRAGPPLRAPRREPGGVGHRRRPRPRRPVPHHRRPHRQPQPAGEAAARHRAGRLPAAGRGGLRRRAAQLLARPRPRAVRPRGRARRRAAPTSGSCASTARSSASRSWPSTSTARSATNGLLLNAQQHLSPVWGLGDADAGRRSRAFVADAARASAPADVLGWDLMAHDLTPEHARRRRRRARSARRGSTTCARRGPGSRRSSRSAADGVAAPPIPVLVLFDHEEIGSTSDRGAASTLLPARPRADRRRARRRPRRPPPGPGRLGLLLGRHGPRHPPELRRPPRARPPHRAQRRPGAQGQQQPALRHRRRQRRRVRARLRAGRRAAASATPTAATCRAAPPSGRSPRPRLGIATFDVGAPQLAMHSARELCGADDPGAATPPRWPRSSRPARLTMDVAAARARARAWRRTRRGRQVRGGVPRRDPPRPTPTAPAGRPRARRRRQRGLRHPRSRAPRGGRGTLDRRRRARAARRPSAPPPRRAASRCSTATPSTCRCPPDEAFARAARGVPPHRRRHLRRPLLRHPRDARAASRARASCSLVVTLPGPGPRHRRVLHARGHRARRLPAGRPGRRGSSRTALGH